MNQGRLIGLILMAIGGGITILAGLFLAVRAGEDGATALGTVLGAGLAFVFVAPLIGFGLFMWVKGGQEAQEESAMQKQRELLDILRSRGQVDVRDMAVEMGESVDTVKGMVHQLVGLQVFSGYINWDKGMLYSTEASQLRDLKECKNCGGNIELAGKGVVACPYCGTEYFLT